MGTKVVISALRMLALYIDCVSMGLAFGVVRPHVPSVFYLDWQ